MKGLNKYLRKHGYHFTEGLVKEVIPIVWDFSEIAKVIQDKVWYNCWSATRGDMLFLVNYFHLQAYSKRERINMMLACVGNYSHKDLVFKDWLDEGSEVEDIGVYI